MKVSLLALETVVESQLRAWNDRLKCLALFGDQEYKIEKNKVAFTHGEQRDKIVITMNEGDIKKQKLKSKFNNKELFV